uniref:Uncharacterized protein n=1 Tax=Cacopsylla melanoneura TaxID=428564 RepID=A0A8D9ARH3_9HEMI
MFCLRLWMRTRVVCSPSPTSPVTTTCGIWSIYLSIFRIPDCESCGSHIVPVNLHLRGKVSAIQYTMTIHCTPRPHHANCPPIWLAVLGASTPWRSCGPRSTARSPV